MVLKTKLRALVLNEFLQLILRSYRIMISSDLKQHLYTFCENKAKRKLHSTFEYRGFVLSEKIFMFGSHLIQFIYIVRRIGNH